MQALHDIISTLNGWLWGPPLLIVLFGTHLYLTWRLSFVQRFLGKAIKLSFSKSEGGEGDVSHFGSLTTALAATVGTGNIVGVATAVSLGGPGAVLWMWLTGVFGMSTKYAEALLAMKYRRKTSDGRMLGGPMMVLEHGLNMRWLGLVFSALTAFAAFGIGNMTQANSVAQQLHSSFSTPLWISGLIMAVITAAALIGGIKSISRVCQSLVPFMAVFYIAGCFLILGYNAPYVLPSIKIILISAFNPQAAGAGFTAAVLMAVIRYGVARGLFSNESGLGSAPIVAAAAKSKNPARQALVSMTGTFWDTVVICLLTGLVLVSTMLADGGMASLKGAELTRAAFAKIPVVGPWILTIGLLTFVFSTILGWSYYGERAAEHLFGMKSILPYRILWSIAVYAGAVSAMPFVWDLADLMNALMALPNLFALLMLSKEASLMTRYYLFEGHLDEKEPSAAKSGGRKSQKKTSKR